jgi:hypothetical protein
MFKGLVCVTKILRWKEGYAVLVIYSKEPVATPQEYNINLLPAYRAKKW